jgi:hypothetical protein
MTMMARLAKVPRVSPAADDPVLVAIRRARERPPLPDAERAQLLALDAEATGDPRAWQTTEGFLAKVRALCPNDDAYDDDE